MAVLSGLRYRLAHLTRAALAAWCAAACSTWGAPYTEPSALSPETNLSRARLTLHNGGSVTVYEARVRSDSVVGLVRRQGTSFQPFGVSRADVRSIQLPEPDALRTIVLVGAIVGGILWILGEGYRQSLKT